MDETQATPGDREPKSSKTPLVIGIIVILLIVGYVLAKKKNTTESTTQDTTQQNQIIEPSMQTEVPTSDGMSSSSSMDSMTSSTPSSQPTPSPTPTTEGNTKVFTVTASNYSFDVKEMKVKKGDKVKIIFQNSGGFHDWHLDEFNAATPTIPAGQSATVEFTADKTGTFEYYCSVGSHRQMGMVGKFIVE